jgi:uncharacterized protein (DUF1330 family)
LPAYFIAQIQWNSPEAREDYIKGLGGMVQEYGGTFLVTRSDAQVVEGEWLPGRLVVIEFPTMAALRAWYDSEEYRPILEQRLNGSRSSAIVVEGNPPTPPQK